MDIQLKHITVRELVKGYHDDKEGGVVGYSGRLDIRPAYQREFVYKGKQRDAVIYTVLKDFPLNVMYWSVKKDGNYEIIDGQQRTISLAQYVQGNFSVMYHMGFEKHPKPFHRLPDKIQNQILDYELMIYLCTGTEDERLDWFKVINIAGEKLTDQELRNAVYSGSWVSSAKIYFSRSNCPAADIGGDYLDGSRIRQKYLETAIKWISEGKIEEYMEEHQEDGNAEELWDYFQSVIKWIERTFINKRVKIMKGVDWGSLYNEYKNVPLDAEELEQEIKSLIADKDVTNHKGIYPYLLTGDPKHLNIRQFDDDIKRRVYEKQNGICPICKNKFKIEEMEADHITPWIEGGHTTEDNCQMISRRCNRRKGAK